MSEAKNEAQRASDLNEQWINGNLKSVAKELASHEYARRMHALEAALSDLLDATVLADEQVGYQLTENEEGAKQAALAVLNDEPPEAPNPALIAYTTHYITEDNNSGIGRFLILLERAQRGELS